MSDTKPTREQVLAVARENVDAYTKQLVHLQYQQNKIQEHINEWRSILFLQTRDFKDEPEATRDE